MGYLRREYRIAITKLACELSDNATPDLNTIALAFREHYHDALRSIQVFPGVIVCEFSDVVMMYQMSDEAMQVLHDMQAGSKVRPQTIRVFRWFKASDIAISPIKDLVNAVVSLPETAIPTVNSGGSGSETSNENEEG